MIYFDHAATCPMSEKAIDTMTALLKAGYGNPSSQHRLGREAKNALEGARLDVANLFGLSMKNVLFTGSGTEADNIAIMSAYKNRKKSPGHMITTAIEHEAVLKCAEALEKEGVKVTYIAPDEKGVVRAEDILAAVREDTFLVSVMAVNNEVGSLQPLAEIKGGLPEGVHFHVDAVQAAGHRPRDSYAFADTVAMSGHKFYGPKGVGILLTRKELEPVIYGGGQERGIRSGTENVPGICAMVEALKEAQDRREEEAARISRLSLRLKEGLAATKGVVLTAEGGDDRIVHAMVEGISRDVLLYQLDRRGFALSGGSACQAGAATKSHVLEAMGVDQRGRAPMRVSLGRENTMEEVEGFLDALKEIVEGKRS